MKVLGALESAQIEWFTNAGKPAASSYPYRVIFVTDLKQIQVSDGTNWNPTAIMTYTAATLPAAASSNQNQLAFITDTLQVKVSDGSQWKTIGARLDTYTSSTVPSAASNSNSLIWVSDIQQVQVSNGSTWLPIGSGSGSGSKNYFIQNNANSNFENNSVSPWSACTLTFSSGIPSGAPTLTATQMTIAASATNPLSGSYSLLLTKGGANAQYQGFISGPLTIDREDTAKVLYGSFYYELVSGSADFSGTAFQTYEIWIYNTVSGVWTQPAGYRGMNQSSGVGKVIFNFQTDGTFANNTYKIAIITQQTSTTANSIRFDDFTIGPSETFLGAPITNWASFTPTGTWTSSSTYSGQWRRVGDTLEVQGRISLSGAPTSTQLSINIPFGLSIDTAKIDADTSNRTLGQWSGDNAGVAGYTGTIRYNTSSIVDCNSANASATYLYTAPVNATVPFTWGTGDALNFSFKVPIAGWSTTVQFSNTTDTRVVAAILNGNPASASSGNPIILPSVSNDTHNAYDLSTGRYTVPVTGFYKLFGSLQSASSATTLSIYKNASLAFLAGNLDANGEATFCGMVYANAGDLLDIRPGGTVDATNMVLNILRISGPSVIAASEYVGASYYLSANGSFGTSSPINYDVKLWDSHGSVTTGTGWNFTCPISGTYTISGYYGGATTSSVVVYLNGTLFKYLTYAISTSNNVSFCSEIKLNAGDYIDFRPSTTVTVNGGSSTALNASRVEIVRVGNY